MKHSWIIGGAAIVLLLVVGLAIWLWPARPVDPDDTDADGLPDKWELRYFSSLKYGPEDDPDKDGLKNVEEHKRGPAFRPNVRSTVNSGDNETKTNLQLLTPSR